jgi:hypothetical protein
MSYQKNDNGGAYQPIASGNKGSKKWVYGAVIVVIAAVVGYFAVANKPGALVDAAISKAALPTTKDGKLKLFDEHSK